MKAYFETTEGETILLSDPMTPEQAAVTYLTAAVGIRRIDEDSIDEFVRRADLYDTYIGGINLLDMSTGSQVPVTRQIIREAMSGHPVLWTDAGLIMQHAFDRMIRIAKEAL